MGTRVFWFSVSYSDKTANQKVYRESTDTLSRFGMKVNLSKVIHPNNLEALAVNSLIVDSAAPDAHVDILMDSQKTGCPQVTHNRLDKS